MSILYPRPWKCAHTFNAEGNNHRILDLYFQKKDNRPRPKWNTESRRFEAIQGANPLTLFFTLFFTFSLDFPIESCAFSSFIIWIRHFLLSWQPKRDIPGKQNLSYFDQSVAYDRFLILQRWNIWVRDVCCLLAPHKTNRLNNFYSNHSMLSNNRLTPITPHSYFSWLCDLKFLPNRKNNQKSVLIHPYYQNITGLK